MITNTARGFFYEQFDGTQLVYHGGTVPGFNSYMGFNQQTGKGVVVLYNVMGIRDQMNNNGIVTPALVFAEETLGVTLKQQSSNTHWGDVIVYTQTALIVLALLTIGRVIYTWVRRTPPARSTRRRVITIVAALVLGIGSVLTLVFGPVALLGFTLPLLYISAPRFHAAMLDSRGRDRRAHRPDRYPSDRPWEDTQHVGPKPCAPQ